MAKVSSAFFLMAGSVVLLCCSSTYRIVAFTVAQGLGGWPLINQAVRPCISSCLAIFPSGEYHVMNAGPALRLYLADVLNALVLIAGVYRNDISRLPRSVYSMSTV